jgi:hypothetical protein
MDGLGNIRLSPATLAPEEMTPLFVKNGFKQAIRALGRVMVPCRIW